VPDGSTLRPDRLCISSKDEVVIIDYKTGAALPKHHEQLQQYKSTLMEMGYQFVEGYLVYTNDPIEIAQV
jgi:RecB family exonuclease